VNPPPDSLVVWTIYDHPADFPAHWVVRCWTTASGDSEPRPSSVGVPHLSLASARASIPEGLVRIPRSEDDVRCVVESWI
jgi:hypothetical protein